MIAPDFCIPKKPLTPSATEVAQSHIEVERFLAMLRFDQREN